MAGERDGEEDGRLGWQGKETERKARVAGERDGEED